jgi:hypothetical protein
VVLVFDCLLLWHGSFHYSREEGPSVVVGLIQPHEGKELCTTSYQSSHVGQNTDVPCSSPLTPFITTSTSSRKPASTTESFRPRYLTLAWRSLLYYFYQQSSTSSYPTMIVMGTGGINPVPDMSARQGWLIESEIAREQEAVIERERQRRASQRASNESTHHRRSRSRRRSESAPRGKSTEATRKGSHSHVRSNSQIRSENSTYHRRSESLTRRSENKPPKRVESRHPSRVDLAVPRRTSSFSRERQGPTAAHTVKTTLRPSIERSRDQPVSAPRWDAEGSLSVIWAFTELRLQRLARGKSCVHFDPSKDSQGCKALAAKMHHSFGESTFLPIASSASANN